MSGKTKLNLGSWTLIAGERGNRTEQMAYAQGWLVRTTVVGMDEGQSVSMIYVPDAAQAVAAAESMSLRMMAEYKRLADAE